MPCHPSPTEQKHRLTARMLRRPHLVRPLVRERHLAQHVGRGTQAEQRRVVPQSQRLQEVRARLQDLLPAHQSTAESSTDLFFSEVNTTNRHGQSIASRTPDRLLLAVIVPSVPAAAVSSTPCLRVISRARPQAWQLSPKPFAHSPGERHADLPIWWASGPGWPAAVSSTSCLKVVPRARQLCPKPFAHSLGGNRRMAC